MTDIIKLARDAEQSAVKTLEQLGYTYHGGELWKPPLGKAPDFSLIDSLRAENDELRTDAECFRFWVHEAWHSPADMARLLSKCETKQDYIDAIIPMIEASRAAIDTARAKEQTP